MVLGNYISAQHALSGVVMGKDHTPLEYANILLYTHPDSTFVKGGVSDEKGHFNIMQIPVGNYYLMISALGFASYSSAPIFIETDIRFPAEILLGEDAAILDEVEVIAKMPLYVQQIDRTVVNVQNSVTSAGSTVLEILERSPGIDVDRINNTIAMQGKQGVVVMINGKAVRVEGEALIQLLQSMAADNIERLELISTPPASFDAQGDAGIIDIITTKNQGDGILIGYNANVAYGLRPKYGTSMNLNFRKNKLNLFADLSATYTLSQEDAHIRRESNFGDQILFSDIQSYRPATTGLYSGRMGMDWSISANTTIGAVFSGYLRKWTLEARTLTLLEDNLNGNTYSEFLADELNKWTHGLANINLRHTFPDNSELTVDIDYLGYFDDNPVSYDGQFFDESGQLIRNERFDSNKETPINFQVLKADYKKTINELASVETGLKGTLSNFTNDLSVIRYEGGSTMEDPRFTDVFDMQERIGAAYVSADIKPSEQLSAKAGVRYEYYFSNLSSQQEGTLLEQNFGRLFPSVFLSYQKRENESWQLSYNERIRRPAFNTLAPAFFFWNHNTILGGNPTVKPTISRKISLGYQYKRLSLSAQFTDDDHPLTLLVDQSEEGDFTITRAINMADAKRAIVSANWSWKPFDWWESRYNAAAYWLHLKPIFADEILDQKGHYMTVNTTQQFSLPQAFSLELSGQYRSPYTIGFGTIAPRGRINIGVQKKLGPNSKLSLNWNDLFDLGSFYRVTVDQSVLNTYYNWYYETEGNVFRLNFSWQFGNTSFKASPGRKTGSESERQRMN